MPAGYRISESKRRMRSAAKAARAEAFARHGAAAASRVAANGIGFAGRSAPACVSAFSAIGDEIDPVPLMDRLRGEGYRLCLPVMVGKGQPLAFRAYELGDALAATTWGIREPVASAPEVEPEILLVPLLLFDAEGYRLGYGGGFYDRTLTGLRARKSVTAIGLAYDEQRVDALPHLDYDQRLDWVLTPSGPLRCSI
jgi:5-formyltetrahydrofolate cyclo-ligase